MEPSIFHAIFGFKRWEVGNGKWEILWRKRSFADLCYRVNESPVP